MGRSRGLTKIAKDIDANGNLLASAISPDVTLGGATVYADRASLPVSGNTAGDQAYVTANNRLYIWNGSGWYNVALLNVAPAISSIQDSDGNTTPFRLSTEGAVTTITITAADSDGDAITYSATADSDFAGLATISDSDNVFTITPLSQDSATTESGTITFKATDGVNIASSGVQTFTLVFVSAFWSDVVLSIGTSSTNSLDNSTFVDRQSSPATITTTGSPIQTAFHPYLDNWSVEFDGTGDALTIPADASHQFGTGDFTVEFWVYMNTVASDVTFLARGASGGAFDLLVQYRPSISNNLKVNTGSSYAPYDFSWTPSAATWYHVAVTRSGTDLKAFIDGSQIGSTQTDSNNINANVIASIGYNSQASVQYLNGYMSNVRLLKGTALYTSNFTPPTEKLTAVSGTSLLTCQSNRFIDNSSNDHAITVSGDPAISAFNPFGQGSEYAPGENKGSVYFDGTNDYASIPDSSNWDFGNGDFTIELWTYMLSYTGNTANISSPISQWNTGNRSWVIYISNTNAFFAYTSNGSTQVNIASTSIPIKLNTWTHLAIVRESSTVTFYLDGVSAGTGNIGTTAIYNSTYNLNIATTQNGGYGKYNGYISDIKIIKGTAAYTSNFTPPTAPVGNTNASLYLPMDNAGIYDKTGNSTLTLVGNTVTSTTQTKFATTSIYFDGTGDYAEFSLPAIGTNDFTFEGWVYFSTIQASYIFDCREVASGTTHPALDIQNDWRYIADNSYVITSGVTPSANQWYHFAVVRNSGTTTLYIDGTSIGSAADSRSYLANPTATIGMFRDKSGGGPLHGYLENFQILNGIAKYTANFTPPNRTQGRTYQAED